MTVVGGEPVEVQMMEAEEASYVSEEIVGRTVWGEREGKGVLILISTVPTSAHNNHISMQ